jgi:hypothetical protein
MLWTTRAPDCGAFARQELNHVRNRGREYRGGMGVLAAAVMGWRMIASRRAATMSVARGILCMQRPPRPMSCRA